MSIIFNGTTGVACLNTRRNFIGIEKDENYFKLSKERILKRYNELKRNDIFRPLTI